MPLETTGPVISLCVVVGVLLVLLGVHYLYRAGRCGRPMNVAARLAPTLTSRRWLPRLGRRTRQQVVSWHPFVLIFKF